jgi:hypothetical protein
VKNNMEDFDSLNEKQLESLERGLSDLKNNRVMTSDEFWKGLLSKKEQQLLIDEAYRNYYNYMRDDRQWELDKEEFINKCKNDKDFSEKWGLKIEQRELSLEERYKIALPIWKEKYGLLANMMVSTNVDNTPYNIPTKLITITYNDKTIESYE